MQTQTADTAFAQQQLLDLGAALQESQDKVAGWLEGLVTLLPNLIAALIILAIFLVIARFIRRAALRVLNRVSAHPDVNRLAGALVYLFVLFTGLFLALDVLGWDRTVTSLLAGAGIIGIALGFAFQDTADNFISGVFLAVRRQFTDGDIVETNGFRGIVEDVTLRATVLRTMTGQRVVIPNSKVYKEPLTNFTALGVRRVDLEVGVSYGDDLRHVAELALDAVRDIEGVLKDRPLDVFFTGFGDSSIDLVVRFWIPYGREPDFLDARSEAVVRIKEAFDNNGVTIPFPIRTLDFSEVGGDTLARAWPGPRDGLRQGNSHGS